jgi:alpha-tubulin suppressor-like RCC1 family protein
MIKLSRVKSSVTIMIISFMIILNSCSKDKNPFDEEFNIVPENNLPGKLKSDFGSYAILKPDSTLWTWGSNWSGTGTEESSYIPVKVKINEKIIDFDMDEGMAVAADCIGNIWFWGTNMFSSALWPVVPNPIKCSFLGEIKAIGIIASHVYMIKNDGTIWHLKIESDVISSFYEPELISNLERIVAVSQSIALKGNRTLCELQSTKPESGGLVPVNDVIAVQNVKGRRTVVLKGDGTVWAWGKNSIGQLGNGSFEDSNTPVQVKNLNNITQISANYDFNLALTQDGTLWFWGFTGKRDVNNKPIGINIPERINNLDDVVIIHAGPTCLVMKNDYSYWYFNCGDRIPKLKSFE